MAACRRRRTSLDHIFEKPSLPPENPTLLQSLYDQIKFVKPAAVDDSNSFTEIFGELHFKERDPIRVLHSTSRSEPHEDELDSSSNSWSTTSTFSADEDRGKKDGGGYNVESTAVRRQGERFCFSSMNSGSLSLCTESLGFESSDDVEDTLSDSNSADNWQLHQEAEMKIKQTDSESCCEAKIKARTYNYGSRTAFPPPISSIGKPWMCFKSYREDGRFILRKIRFPTQEFLHACREDGRLKLHFVQSDDDHDEIVMETEEMFEEDERERDSRLEDEGKIGEERRM